FADEISRELIAAGRAPEAPAAIVINAARADQQVIVTTLAGLAALEAGNAPSIIVIGENVRLAAELSWLTSRA
ncbi:MAG: cobA, partial [Alphaproteobacteria bacterium]|nr:cobA [Alphaproteobacteria bacterium]